MTRGVARSVAAASLLLAAPLAAQTGTPTTTNGLPPRTTDTKPPPKVTPEQIIGVVKGLLQPKPTPTPPPPPPPPSPTPAPTATAVSNPRPTPTPTPRATATSAPRPAQTAPPIQLPPPVAVPAPVEIAPEPVAAGDPPPIEVVTPAPDPVAAPVVPPEEDTPIWPWIVAGVAALGLGETARRWFWPKAALNCEIAVGPSALTGASVPALTKPDTSFDIRIELGEASAPIGRPVLAQGDDA